MLRGAEQSSMNIIDQLSRTKTKDEIAAAKAKRKENAPEVPTVTEPERGRDQTDSITASSAHEGTDTSKLAPKREWFV